MQGERLQCSVEIQELGFLGSFPGSVMASQVIFPLGAVFFPYVEENPAQQTGLLWRLLSVCECFETGQRLMVKSCITIGCTFRKPSCSGEGARQGQQELESMDIPCEIPLRGAWWWNLSHLFFDPSPGLRTSQLLPRAPCHCRWHEVFLSLCPYLSAWAGEEQIMCEGGGRMQSSA